MNEHGISVRVLVNNATGEGSWLAEHGLALWVTVPQKDGTFNFLFDTGQTGTTLARNAGLLKLGQRRRLPVRSGGDACLMVSHEAC